MFLYPALTIGFLFVAVPLLVHLINMLRHRRQRWAAMDFLLASYRKQRKWIRLRQLLLLLSRLAMAAILIALLAGWTGGRQMLGILGGQTNHHVVILDDSYSMGDESFDPSGRLIVDPTSTEGESARTAYGRALQTLQDLTRQLAGDDQTHHLTVMRASRAAMATRGGSESGDAAADLSAQTITSDASIINRLMGSSASSLNTDMVPALDLAASLINSTPADAKYLYIASDFRQRDWGSAERITEAIKGISGDVTIQLVDCAAKPAANLAITDVSPQPDVWVAGVPVVVNVTVRNYGNATATNVSLANRVIRYGSGIQAADPTLLYSGTVDPLPPTVIESIAPGAETTKSFQVYITETGTHVIEAALPDDALAIDNTRSCTLPLTEVEKVLIIDGDPDQRGAFHVASVLNPGSQVRIGAVPEVQSPAFLRSVSVETLAAYRAIYLIDIPEIGQNGADTLADYVRRGGGIAWFLGGNVSPTSYNERLISEDRRLIPGPLTEPIELSSTPGNTSADVQFAGKSPLLDPLRAGGDNAFALVGVTTSWDMDPIPIDADSPVDTILERGDGKPLVLRQELGRGRIITVLTGLDGTWTNWPGDPTFVVFLLQANADLWSGAAPKTARFVDDPLVRLLSEERYASQAAYLPAAPQPPRVPIEVVADPAASDSSTARGSARILKFGLNPDEMVIDGADDVDAVLQPGVSEWTLNRADGRSEVVPVASVLRVGEGDLQRADHAAITQQLLPTEVAFVSNSAWSEENTTAGTSTVTLVLLGLLVAVLGIEQTLAYWASYHVSSTSSGQEHAALAHLGGRR